MDGLLRDLRYAARGFLRTPAFTAVAVLTLALGIGTNTAMFAVVNAVLLKPLPFADADRLMLVHLLVPDRKTGTQRENVWSYPKYGTLLEMQDVFVDTALFAGRDMSLPGDGEPVQVRGEVVTERFGYLVEKGDWYTIVGVVKEIRDRGVAEDLKPAVYRLHEQADQSGDEPSGIVVGTAVEPVSIVPAVRQAIWSLDRNQPITKIQTVDNIVARQLSVPSQNTALLGTFALLALLLASIGLYGVLSYAVTQRTGEIGVRMTLAATSGNILRSFARQGLALTFAGLVIGVVLAAIAARVMTALFFGVRPDYLPVVAVVSLVLLAVAATACIVPARRASRVDPAVALQRG